MRLATFCCYLAFLVFCQPAATARPISGNRFTQPESIKNTVPGKFITLAQGFVSVKDSPLTDDEETLVWQEVEDEDANDVLTKKYRSLADVYAVPSYQSILDFHYNRPRPLPLCQGQVCHRYIVQRVLRI